MADAKVSALTAASDLVSAVLVGETSGVNKSYPIALFDTRYQAASANLTSWAGVTRASGFDTFAATPNSANFASLLTDETGTGKVVFSDSPLLTTTATINGNSTSLPSTPAGTILQIGAADTVSTRLLLDSFGANNNLTFRASLGTAAARTALVNGSIIGGVVGFGAYDATNYSAGGRASMTYSATETWSSTTQGTKIDFFTTLNGSTATSTALTLGNDKFAAFTGAIGRAAPVIKTADFTVAATETWLINNKAAATCTVTLPSASTYTGREITITNRQAFTVVSASSNVVPIAGGAAGTAILAATAGKFATLVSDGTNWLILASN